MKPSLVLLALLTVVALSRTSSQNDRCRSRTLANSTAPAAPRADVAALAERLTWGGRTTDDFAAVSEDAFGRHADLVGVLVRSPKGDSLGLRLGDRLEVSTSLGNNATAFADSLRTTPRNGWGRAFKECDHLGAWVYSYVHRARNTSVALFVRIDLDRCDRHLGEIFGGAHRCDEETTHCVRDGPSSERSGKYRCVCRKGFYYPHGNFSWNGFSGEDIEIGRIDAARCIPCPDSCEQCEQSGLCVAQKDFYLKTAILCVQLACMAVTVVLALVVFKQRKTKAIASGMWTILETILLGIFILYSTVVVRFFDPSVMQCLLEPWFREVGFIICYGAIILKLYRHLIEFRTRKAHRWVVKDTDLLKYLLIMVMSVLAYMAAYTSITLNFIRENYSLLYVGHTLEGEKYTACKSLWWDYVTESGELVILIFGIHLSYASRNARTQFHERTFLCVAISLELAVSTLFYVGKVLLLPDLHPDLVLIIYCLRTQLSQSVALALIFVPKFWYQQKQVRNLAQEYSCRIPVDAFKDNAHGPLTSNNSDVDVGEVTLADMSPDDIRAELKRLYLQLEIFKSKTLCRDNPHISKRRGGRKAQHRRFSLQKKGSREKNLHGRHKEKERQKQQQEETTEAEPSRTPEDSVCSNEGPSAIYADLPSTADHK